jgi:glycosyltransferase involved in cell wall biosynthesis
MDILLLNPFNSGSHKEWAHEFAAKSTHNVTVWNLRGKYWKWRMHGAAVSFSKRLIQENIKPDLIIATDLMDLAVFRGLADRYVPNAKYALYFHENQISYPVQNSTSAENIKRDMHYGYINFTSALAADKIFFNSEYHKQDFIRELPLFLKAYPDERNLHLVEDISSKSSCLHLGVDLQFFDALELPKNPIPTFLWNHRHEHDKNPNDFFNALNILSSEGYEFKLIVLGESYKQSPGVFKKAIVSLAKHILHWGYTDSKEEYAKLLWQASHLPVTSIHDFFGQSVLEAAYCNVLPILPNRLAYPEHFEGSDALFYSGQEEFMSCLRQVLDSEQQGVSFPHLKSKYDWSALMPKYDKEMQLMLS